MKSLTKIFTLNYIINLSIIFLLIYIRKYSELFFGILGSFVFFQLTELNKEYNNNKLINGYGNMQILINVIINFLILYILADFEKLYNAIIYKTVIEFDFGFLYHCIILIIFMSFNLYFNYITKKIKSIIKNK